MKISLVDYGVGNIFSVGQALKALNIDFTLDSDGKSILKSDLVIVPGVAAFGVGMKNLEERGQAEELRNFFSLGKPLIGLCLGAQMFLNSSTESALSKGFGFVEGKVIALDENLCRVPQQGWSKLEAKNSSTFSKFHTEYFYFSHGYKMIINDLKIVAHTSQHEREKVTAFFIDKNVLGIQFHPERSGPIGLKFLEKAILDANIWT
jgi:glutamine amidotransferase